MKTLVRLCIVSCFPAFLISLTSKGESGTWLLNPADDDFDNAANWSSDKVPSLYDTASFAQSNQTEITFTDTTYVTALDFVTGAFSYEFNVPPDIDVEVGGEPKVGGGGLINNSGVAQNFFVRTDTEGGDSFFQIYGDGGTLNNFTAEPQRVTGGGRGYVWIAERGNAGTNNTITSEGGIIDGGGGGYIGFYNSGLGGQAVITNQAGTVSGATGGTTTFWTTTGAQNATIICEGATVGGASGGALSFIEKSKGGNATLIAQSGSNSGGGGLITLSDQADGTAARVEVFGNGTLDISALGTSGAKIGSLEGDGIVLLGSKTLSLGSNNLSTTFSGAIQGSGPLVENGSATFTLSGVNSYSGGTTVKAGVLLVTNTSGSATGTNAVKVNAGTLGGKGIIAGAVTLGTGSGSGAFLAPAGGTGKPDTLTIQKALTLDADATYTCTLQASKKKSANDEVVANGVTINGGAQFNLVAKVQGKLKTGGSFTVISNTASTPISGTFANLSDGAILTVGNIKLQASYEGGDENDLVLTVAP